VITSVIGVARFDSPIDENVSEKYWWWGW